MNDAIAGNDAQHRFWETIDSFASVNWAFWWRKFR